MIPSVIIPIQVMSKEFLIYLDHLHFALKAVQIQTMECEKILLDYLSTPEFVPHIQKIARQYGFTYVRALDRKDKLWCRGRALNDAYKLSEGNPMLFVDSDCLLPPTYVQRHCKYVTEGTITFSPFYDTTENIIKSANYKAVFKQKGRITGLRPNSYSHIGIMRSWFKEHGGYDEDYRGWGAEDDDIMLRFKRTKMKIIRVPAYPIHLWHPTWQQLMDKAGKTDVHKNTLKVNRRKFWDFRGRGPRTLAQKRQAKLKQQNKKKNK